MQRMGQRAKQWKIKPTHQLRRPRMVKPNSSSHGTQQIEIISMPIIENWSAVNYFVCFVVRYWCLLLSLGSLRLNFRCAHFDFVDHCYGYCWFVVHLAVVVSFKSFQLIKNIVSAFLGSVRTPLSCSWFSSSFYSLAQRISIDLCIHSSSKNTFSVHLSIYLPTFLSLLFIRLGFDRDRSVCMPNILNASFLIVHLTFFRRLF